MQFRFSIFGPVGSDGRAPFSPITREQDRIIQNVRNILSTEPGEWPMDPTKGCGLRGFLDEPAHPLTIRLIRNAIKRQLNKYEKGATVEAVIPSVQEEGNIVSLRVELILALKILPSLITVEVGASYLR